MESAEVILALAKVFIMILPGYILAKLNVLQEPHTSGISSLITCITYPCLVISAMQMEFSWEILNNCKYVVLIFIGVVLVAMVISKVLTSIIRMPASQSGIMAFMMVFGNTGFLGLPVLDALFGKEAVFYGALADSSFDLLMFTFGVTFIRQAAKGEEKMGIGETMKGLVNPCFVGVLIGLTLYASQIMLGSHLARIRLLDMFKSWQPYLVCLLKLLVAPAIALVLVKLIIGGSTLFGTVIVMEAAMPCAMLSVILSDRYGADVNLATKGVMLTTIMCLVTIPIVAITLQYI